MAALLRGTILSFLALLATGISSCQAQSVNASSSRIWFNDPNAEGIQSLQIKDDIHAADVNHILEFQRARFSLGFVNSSLGLFTLAVVLILPDFSRVIWEANRDDPVGFNASVTLTSDGDFLLREADGRLIWWTGTANQSATVIQIQETGNLVILATNQTIIWQSFDHPTDTISANQILQSGMKLQSRRSKTDSFSGFYSLVMEMAGLVLYSNFSGIQEPYWIRGYSGQDHLAAVTRSDVCGSGVFAVLDGSTTELNFNMNCSATVKQQQLEQKNAEAQNQSFLRLDYDGNLRGYIFDSFSGQWNSSLELFNETSSCDLPQKCQPFGVCVNGSCNECLSSDGSTGAWNENCTLPVVQSCADIPMLEFVAIPGAEYFSSKYLSSARSFESCRRDCLNSCSCVAFFYWEDSGSCFMTSNMNTLQKGKNQTHVAYIKVSKPSGSGLAAGATAGIVIGCLFLVLVISAVPAMLWFKRRKRRRTQATDHDQNLEAMRFSYADLERITEGFSKRIGAGDAYEGVLRDGKKVAVKKLKTTQRQSKETFLAEVGMVGDLHHWNVMKLLGFCSEGRSCRFLIYEFMGNGSLDKWIYRDEEEEMNFLDWELRMGVVLGMARGLAYLHDECRIMDLDLRPVKVFLDSSFVAKVDPGFVTGNCSSSQSLRDAAGYLAPEWLRGASVTEKSDVYSFGIVLLEVVSGIKCLLERDKLFLPEFAAEIVRDGGELKRLLVDPRLTDADEVRVQSAVKIAFECVQEEPRLRPSMRKVVKMLEGSCEISGWTMPSKN